MCKAKGIKISTRSGCWIWRISARFPSRAAESLERPRTETRRRLQVRNFWLAAVGKSKRRGDRGREAADTGPAGLPARSRVPGPLPSSAAPESTWGGAGTHHCTASPGSSWPASAGPAGGSAALSPPRRDLPTAWAAPRRAAPGWSCPARPGSAGPARCGCSPARARGRPWARPGSARLRRPVAPPPLPQHRGRAAPRPPHRCQARPTAPALPPLLGPSPLFRPPALPSAGEGPAGLPGTAQPSSAQFSLAQPSPAQRGAAAASGSAACARPPPGQSRGRDRAFVCVSVSVCVCVLVFVCVFVCSCRSRRDTGFPWHAFSLVNKHTDAF